MSAEPGKVRSSVLTESHETETGGSGWWKRGALFVLLVVIAGTAYMQFGEALTLENLARQETQLREFQSRHPVAVYGIAFVVYAAVTGLSIPGGAAMSLMYGWYFGLLRGLLLVSFASTTGATLAFLLSRFLFREAIQRRFGERLTNFNQALEREGPFFLFMLRLMPAVPFFMINAVMGLTPIRTWTYWWISQVGMLPGTAIYIYAGSSVPSLKRLADEGINAVLTPVQLTQIFLAFALLGIFPLAIRWIMKKVTRCRN
jgi:uncharacterized membrane protein YdjX (TVP38/TMEM64 family)